MGLFGFLKATPIRHPRLGTLVWSRGYWRGTLAVAGQGEVPALIAGSRSGPSGVAAELAGELPSRYPALAPVVAQAMFNHLEPYQEAVAAGEVSDPLLPSISGPAEVWPHVKLDYVLVEPLSGAMTVELVCTAAWDDEHALGARFVDWIFLELCGSVRRLV